MYTELLQTQKHYDGVEHFIRLFKIPDQKPSLSNLNLILKAFSNLPYENLSKIIKLNRIGNDGLPFRFPAEVIQDHELYKLGGTCFSLTFTLKCILDYFGYQTEILMADMKFAPNSHCLLLLHLDGKKYLVDPGYLITRPLELSQFSDLGSIKLVYKPESQKFELWTAEQNKLKWRYSFQNQPVDFEQFGRLWKESFHWFSMHGICLSKRDENSFLYIHNHYIKYQTPGQLIKGNFNEDLGEMVERYFKIEKEMVQKAQKALLENIHYDRELGYQVPKWALK